MTAQNDIIFSRPELLCFGTFLIIGLIVVLAVRHPKQMLAIFITVPIAGLCGGSAYLIARLMYSPQAGALYGFSAFALAGLIIISALRCIANIDVV